MAGAMRIVDVCAFYSPSGGGIRTYVEAKVRASAQLGHESVIVVPGDQFSTLQIAENAVLATIPGPMLLLDRRYRYFNDEPALWRELDRWRPDHVECSSPWRSAAYVARWPGSATRSLVMHSDPLSAYAYRWLGGLLPKRQIDRLCTAYWSHLRSVGRRFDLIVSPNHQLGGRLFEQGLQRVTTIPLGVERDRFAPRLRQQRLRAAMLESVGLPPSATLFVGVGRLSAEKRWELVIRACGELARSMPAAFFLVGDGMRRRQLVSMSSRYPTVRLVGQIDDRDKLARVLASADALVHGCEAETFGLAIAEARASGTPVIVPDAGGAIEQLGPGAGLAYCAGNERSLLDSLAQFTELGGRGAFPAAIAASQVRTLDDHFRELFDCYSALPRQLQSGALNGVPGAVHMDRAAVA